LFGDFDAKIEPYLKAEYDHALLINVNDPLHETLGMHTERTGEVLKLKRFEVPTSVENLAFYLFSEITDMGFRLNRLELQETDTSVVTYTREDWIADSRSYFGRTSDRTTDQVDVQAQKAASCLSVR
jgi:6-pyruvoyltetrahydropterin/6-carboxytetrahydropterin synthase